MSGNDWHGKYYDGDWSEPKQATPDSELLHQLLDSSVPKTEREHAAVRRLFILADINAELLEVLEELYHLIDDAHDGDRVFTFELAQKAKAAIAKARGQG